MVLFISVWSALHNSDGSQASRANIWPQDSHPLLGSHASAFDYSIRFIPLKENAVADALLRLPLPSTLSGENAPFKVEERLKDLLPISRHRHTEISHATRVDPVLSKVLEFVRHGWPHYKLKIYAWNPFLVIDLNVS